MIDALPLMIFMWALNRGGGVSMPAQARKVRKRTEPRWPSTKSPPPIPAFQPKQTRSPADPTGSSTPLAQLHKAPPQVERPKTVLETAKSSALSMAKKRGQKGFRAILDVPGRRYHSLLPRSKTMSNALVSNLQQIVNNHGGKLTQDGLYGPRTASAWQSLAKSKGLDPEIKRESAKMAKVATATFERLQVPPIP